VNIGTQPKSLLTLRGHTYFFKQGSHSDPMSQCDPRWTLIVRYLTIYPSIVLKKFSNALVTLLNRLL